MTKFTRDELALLYHLVSEAQRQAERDGQSGNFKFRTGVLDKLGTLIMEEQKERQENTPDQNPQRRNDDE